jgi:hypothetical protein
MKGGIESLDLAGYLAVKTGGIELRNLSGAAFARKQGCPKLILGIAYGCNGSKARYYYSSSLH